MSKRAALTLTNPRWELFVQNRAEGMSISKSYILAGFNVSKEVGLANGSRLLRNAHVLARLRQLIDIRAERTVVTRETLAAQNVNVNLSGTFNQMTDDELRYELASLVNAVRAAKGQPLVALPARKDAR
jgi:hypothetical protein